VSGLGYACALLLAGAFAWAGAAKLSDRARTTTTFAALGVPGAGALGRALPVGEVVLAIGLVVVPGLASFAALGLLAAFTTFLVGAVRRHLPVACGCFGSASEEPVGRVDVVRNLLLVAAALVATSASGPQVPGLGAVVVVAVAAATATGALAAARRRERGVVGGPRR
jgi:uncharacterized membrane protein YphA (DoxX/SURF4 family)